MKLPTNSSWKFRSNNEEIFLFVPVPNMQATARREMMVSNHCSDLQNEQQEENIKQVISARRQLAERVCLELFP